jgi:DNA polymerase-1
LMKKIEAAAKTGHIIGMDGRKIPIRSKHATLNTLLQSDGSIIVKWATCWCMAKIREAGLRARLVIHYHDEVVLECHPDDAQAAGELFIKGIKWAGHLFKVRCPLSGDMTIGNNWAEIH